MDPVLRRCQLLILHTIDDRLMGVVHWWDDTDREKLKYRVSIKSFPDYEHLLQENYVEYKRRTC